MSHSDPASPEGEGTAGTSTEQRLADVVAAYRALQAENDSYRERVSRNAERRFAQRHERLLLKFIDILDNLDRALDASELGTTGGAMIEGLILVRTQLLQTLQEEGLERIPVMGIPYDPEVAEAVGTQPVDDPDHHHVVMKDIRRGYRLKGKLARAAQVIVGEYRGELPAREPEAYAPPAEESGRVEVVSQGDESTGEIAALAAQAAAAVAGGGPIGGDAGDGTPEDSEDSEDSEDVDDDTDLETAAREAAEMAGGDEDGEVPVFADGDAGAPVFSEEGETAEDPDADGVIADAASLEDAAREAAALVGADGPDEDESETEGDALETGGADAGDGGPERDAAPAPGAEAEAESGEKRPRPRPLHPLDDVDPSAFEDAGAEPPED